MSEPTGWFPVFTLLLGYGTRWVSDWVQHRRTVEREREARRELRHDALAERRAEFQRQTLLDLQETVLSLARSAAQMNHFDEMEYRKSGIWHPHPYPSETDESFRAANARASMLSVRVRDSEVRDLAGELREHTWAIGLAKTATDANISSNKMASAFEQLQERIGVTLHALDENTHE